jgi:hypothetical protein
MTTTTTRTSKSSTKKTPATKKAATKKPAVKKPAAKKTVTKKSAKKPAPAAPASVSAGAIERADRLERITSLFVSESGAEHFAIFGAHGPVLWSKGLEFKVADLALWRRMLADESAQGSTRWNYKHFDEALVLAFENATEPGHVLARVPDEEAARINPELDPAEFTIFVGAKYGNLHMVFAGSPSSFADGDFQGIYDTLRACGLLG